MPVCVAILTPVPPVAALATGLSAILVSIRGGGWSLLGSIKNGGSLGVLLDFVVPDSVALVVACPEGSVEADFMVDGVESDFAAGVVGCFVAVGSLADGGSFVAVFVDSVGTMDGVWYLVSPWCSSMLADGCEASTGVVWCAITEGSVPSDLLLGALVGPLIPTEEASCDPVLMLSVVL